MPRAGKTTRQDSVKEMGKKVKTIATQTSEDDISIQMARLQEQIKLLTIENEVLRSHTDKLHTAPSNGTNTNPLKLLNNIINEGISPVNNQTKVVNEVADQTMNPPRSSKKGIKGCLCKGNCSTKACGCVKKDKRCSEFCKCNDNLCENQAHEPNEDQENVHTNTIPSKGTPKPTVKNKRRRGLFSPNSDHLFSPTIDQSSVTPTESTPHETSIRFGQTPAVKPSSTRNKQKKASPVLDNFEKTGKVDEHINVQNVSKLLEDQVRPNNVVKKEPPGTPIVNNEEDISSVNTDQRDTELHPFKPKRHLPRTPPQKDKEKTEKMVHMPVPEMPLVKSSPSDLHSDLTLSVPLQAASSEPPFKTALTSRIETSESVDWEQHQAQLVACRKCKRKFLPQRIEKHEACCKKM